MSRSSLTNISSTSELLMFEYSKPNIKVISPNTLIIPKGIMEDILLSNSNEDRFNIIKTNMKSIAIAPTYIIRVAKAIKSACSWMKTIAAPMNDRTNHMIEWTGWTAVTTIIPDIIVKTIKIGEIIIKTSLFQGKVPFPSLCYDLL